MVLPARDHLLGLGADVLQILGRLAGAVVHAGGRLDELLPDQDAETVAQVVEDLFLQEAAAPDAQQVAVGIAGQTEPALVALRHLAPVELVDGRPVPSLEEDAAAIHLHHVGQGALRGAVVRHLAHPPDAERDPPAVQALAVLGGEGDHRLVEGLFAVAVGPPEVGGGDGVLECWSVGVLE